MPRISTAMLRKAIQLYRNPMVDKATQRHNQWMWLRAVCILGDRWLLAKPVKRAGGG